ncbi:MAG TPA: glycosyltransferase family 4 protein [Atribacterota bacterium]|nr:glycosyltransferase family 4 protein [Atribacterota bacterium]
MKILMICDYGSKYGGDLTYIVNLKEGLEKKGFVVKIFSSDTHMGEKKFSDYEFKGFSETSIFKGLYYIFNPFSYLKLNKLLKEFKPDIIHLHNIFYQVSFSILLLLKNTPTVMTIHSYELICPNVIMLSPSKSRNICKTVIGRNCRKCIGIKYYYHKFRLAIYKRLSRNVDTFISNSKYTQDIIEKCGIKPVQKIYCGIKLFKYSKMEKSDNLLFAGRLAKEKGAEYLIKAMPLIIKKISTVHLDIVGDGDEKHRLEILTKELNLENNVTFIGSILYSEVEKYYKKANIVIVTSVWPEPFGLIGSEAMSVGRPVIGTKVGGIPEWLEDGETGYLVEPGDPKQIAENVIKLLSDRKLMEKIGRNAMEKAKRFNIKKHVEEIEKVYKNVIEKYKT